MAGPWCGKGALERFLTGVDEEGSPAFLETDVGRNVTLYETFGFQITNREQIVGVDTRFMWRHPRHGTGMAV